MASSEETVKTNTDTVVSCRDVHIKYRIGPGASLRQVFGRGEQLSREVNAVRGVSLDVRRGDVVGIIGLNGSGKSTLLQGCAGVLPLASGEILAASRPTLLTVGGLLNQMMSGRANLKMGCMALGLTGAQVDERMDYMVDFSGLGEFIDMPMFTYSTGMRSRLNFTMATARTPEILLLDEILSGGDQSFRTRAIARIEEIRQAAGAVILVTHRMQEIRRSANRVVWLHEGEIRAEGDPDEVILEYEDVVVHAPKRERLERKRRRELRAARAAAEAEEAKETAESGDERE